MTADVYPLQVLLVTLAGWTNRLQYHVIKYRVEANRVLKGQMNGPTQRRRLAVKGRRLRRRLLRQLATLVTPDTILRWHRQLMPGNGRSRRRRKDVSPLIERMATENPAWDDTRISRVVQSAAGVRIVLIPIRAPNANAYAERSVRSIREECRDRLILSGERRLFPALDEFAAHYHGKRNHQRLGNELITPAAAVAGATRVRCRDRPRRALRYDHRAA